MAKTLEQILGYENLCGVIQGIKPGIPVPIPDSFFSTTQDVLGDSGKYIKVEGTRQTATLAMYGSPARKRKLKGISEVPVKLMHSFEEITIDPLVFQKLRQYGNYALQKQGQDEVSRQVGQFKQLFTNQQAAVTMMVLGNGVVYHDAEGNLLPTSSGAFYTMDFGMSANNQGQIANGSGGYIIDDSWANPSCDISAQIRALQARAAKLTGYELKHAFYGKNIPSYITQNDSALDYLSRDPGVRGEFVGSGELPSKLFGLDWHPIYNAFFEDANGDNQSLFGDDLVIFTPDPSPEWWAQMRGSYQVPTTINLMGQDLNMSSAFDTVYGMFGYSQLTHNPPTANLYLGNTFLPILKVPNAIFQADVVP